MHGQSVMGKKSHLLSLSRYSGNEFQDHLWFAFYKVTTSRLQGIASSFKYFVF